MVNIDFDKIVKAINDDNKIVGKYSIEAVYEATLLNEDHTATNLAPGYYTLSLKFKVKKQ